MRKWLQWMEKWMGGDPNGGKKVQTLRWLLIIGLVGVSIMILNSFVSVKQVDRLNEGRASPKQTAGDQQAFMDKTSKDDAFRDIEAEYESRLKEILEKIVGVGEVDVMVNIDSTAEIVVDQNRKDTEQITDEKDQSGATRHITEVTRSGEVVLYEASGGQTPIILKKIKPQIRGVLIVARGAEQLVVKKLITEAVERGLGVPAYRISIVPRKQ